MTTWKPFSLSIIIKRQHTHFKWILKIICPLFSFKIYYRGFKLGSNILTFMTILQKYPPPPLFSVEVLLSFNEGFNIVTQTFNFQVKSIEIELHTNLCLTAWQLYDGSVPCIPQGKLWQCLVSLHLFTKWNLQRQNAVRLFVLPWWQSGIANFGSKLSDLFVILSLLSICIKRPTLYYYVFCIIMIWQFDRFISGKSWTKLPHRLQAYL